MSTRTTTSLTNFIKIISNLIKLKPKEILILIIYPITILLGQIIYFTSKNEIINNYYTNKYNLINIFFVKNGWFWTCLIYLYLLFQHGKSIKLGLIRLILITLWWWSFTQWFFGLPIMDRIFLFTGGICEYNNNNVINNNNEINEFLQDIGSNLCKQIKGHWIGGHDPSGHVFLLVLGSLMIWFEILQINVFKEFKILIKSLQETEKKFEKFKILLNSSIILSFGLLWLWWWMLLITSIHFHSFIEQISGLIAGCLGLLVYTIPRMFKWG